MIEITCDTQIQKDVLKSLLSTCEGTCVWHEDEVCPRDSVGLFIGCRECVEKYIKWKVREKSE